jgi:hypothetical protein
VVRSNAMPPSCNLTLMPDLKVLLDHPKPPLPTDIPDDRLVGLSGSPAKGRIRNPFSQAEVMDSERLASFGLGVMSHRR